MSLSHIQPFRVERHRKVAAEIFIDRTSEWFDEYETQCKYNIAETCAASISLEDLQALSEDKSRTVFQPGLKLVYGPIRGSLALRSHLASLYSAKTASPLPTDNVLITAGGINANFLAFYTLLTKGDHVICHYPTYQQLYSVPSSLGAEVSLWKTTPERQWQPDIEELKALIKPNTKMIIINNPQNPTGATLPNSLLKQIAEVAAKHDLILFADEIYRPLFHSISPIDPEFPPSVLSLHYPKAVATGSMSKAFALAGIRVGWVASRDSAIIEACASARDYTNISVSQVDDQIATFALDQSCVHALLGRNIQLAKANLEILGNFLNKHAAICSWVRPRAGTTAFVRFSRDGKAVNDVEFCKALQSKTGVFVAPGNECFGEEHEWHGFVRIGYVCETEVLKEGLAQVDNFLANDYAQVPTVE